MELKVNKGKPTKRALYVAYVDTPIPESKFLQKKLLMWMNDDEWWYPGSDQIHRGKVYGWIGPLPTPTKDSIDSDSAYAIGNEKNKYSNGPFQTLEEARSIIGDSGTFIFQIKADSSRSWAVAKWNERKQKWMLRKERKAK